jgi:hypothetical protein
MLLLISREQLMYGFGPILFAILAKDQIHTYRSSLVFTIQLTIITSLYSLLALSSQIIALKKKQMGAQSASYLL